MPHNVPHAALLPARSHLILSYLILSARRPASPRASRTWCTCRATTRCGCGSTWRGATSAAHPTGRQLRTQVGRLRVACFGRQQRDEGAHSVNTLGTYGFGRVRPLAPLWSPAAACSACHGQCVQQSWAAAHRTRHLVTSSAAACGGPSGPYAGGSSKQCVPGGRALLYVPTYLLGTTAVRLARKAAAPSGGPHTRPLRRHTPPVRAVSQG